MSKSAKWLLALLAGAVLLSLGAGLMGRREFADPVARITQDGEVIEEIRLDRVEKSYSFVLENEAGSNTVLVEQGRIRVEEADCPDQVCVKQGWISDGATPIVCLPHKLMIEIVGGEAVLDGVTG